MTLFRSAIFKIAMAAWAAGAALPMPAQSGKLRFGNTLFDLPSAGWRVAEQNGSLTITAPNPPGREAGLIIAPSQPLAGDFRSAFDAFVAYVVAREVMPAFGEVRQYRGPGGDMLSQMVTVGPGAAGRGIRLFVAAHALGRLEVILAMASSESVFRKHQPDFDRFFQGVEYKAPPGNPSWDEYTPRSAPPAIAADAPQNSWRPGAENAGSTQPAPPSLPPLRPRPGWAIGRAVDAAGRPLKDFEITVSRSSISTFGLYASDTFKAHDGRYEIELPKGAFMVQGFATVRQEGQSYRVDLHPLDGHEWNTAYPSDPGIVKDFVLLGSGLRAGQQQNEWGTSNLGGAVTVEDYTFSLPPGTAVEVTLTPIGPLLDGTSGRIIRRANPLVFTITDIPLGKYAVSVRIGGRPVDFELRHTEGGPNVGRGPLVFMPNDAGVAGTKRVRLLVRP